MKKRYISLCCIVIACMMVILSGCQSNKALDQNQEASDNQNQDVKKEEITVDELKAKLAGTDVYTEDYLNEIATTVNTVNDKSNKDSLSYIFITDMHLGADEDQDDAIFRELNAAVDITNNTDAAFLCVGGDTTDGRFASEQGGKQRALDYWKQVCSVLDQCQKPVFILKGNHDDNSFATQINEEAYYNPEFVISNAEWYEATMGNFTQYTTDYQNGYYYYDLPDKNIRVVCLNMSDSDDTVTNGSREEIGMHFYGYKDTQIDWLLNTAMTREDCEYVFLCHDGFEYPSGYAEGSNRDTLKNILIAADGKQPFQTDKFAKDFTNWTGKIDLYHYGHFHHERTIFDPTMNNIPVLTTESARIFQYRNSQMNPVLNPNNGSYWKIANRELDTINEAVFDVVVKNQKEFDIIRFGDGDDWQLK